MDDPHFEEDIQKKLIRCHCKIPKGNHYIVPFICAAAVPHGLLYWKDLESTPTVSDTFIALVNYSDTNRIALTLIKFALERSGCAPETIKKLCEACRKVGSQKYPEYDICALENEPFFERFQFHKMLVDVSDALTGDEKRRVINLGSAFIRMNLTHTDSLLVHFLRLLQGDVIGPGNVTKIKEWLGSIQRQDVIGTIDEPNSESIHGGQMYPEPEQESRGHRMHNEIEEHGEFNGRSQVQQSQRFHAIQPPMEGPLAGDLYQQPIQETAREGPRFHAINHIGVHNMDRHIVERDNPTGSNQEQPEIQLETCTNGGDHTAIPTNLHKRKFSIWCCLWLLIILLGISSLIVLALYPSSHSENCLAYQGDTIHIASANGFWYHNYSVAEHVEQGDDNCELQFYAIQCVDLQVHYFQHHFQSRELYLAYKTRTLGILDYLYLLPESNVSYNICLWTNQSLTTSAEFFVFDSLTAYQDYISDVTDGRDTSVMQQELRIGSPEDPACSQIMFIVDESAYYFMSADCPGGVTYQYNITSNVKFLNSTDYEDFLVCSVTENQPCEIAIEQNFLGAWKDICLLAYAIPSPLYSVDSLTTHINAEIVKRYQVLVIPATLIVIGILGLLGMLLVNYCIRRKTRSGYTIIK